LVDDLNTDVAEGFGRIDTNIADGRRASTALAYAQPARRRGNLELLAEAVATRIVIEGGQARGVETFGAAPAKQSGQSARSSCAAAPSTRRSS
jgi:choline dehydrogenase-like flavoprotein